MKRLASCGALLAIGCMASAAQPVPTGDLTLSAGTRIELVVTAPLWMKSVKPGDPVYMQTTFPVVTQSGVAIPAGSYVLGKLLDLKRPTRFNSHGEVDMLLQAISFANGYVVVLPDAPSSGPAPDTPATAMRYRVQVSAQSDLLLDNGAQLEMILAAPVQLDAAQVNASLAKARRIVPGTLRSASRCMPTPATPGSPGTPDTVIPGTSGTPDTVIPGAPGQPDITIPGTPATPDTVIPGTPGTPGFDGRACPAPPLVIASEALKLPLPSSQRASTNR